MMDFGPVTALFGGSFDPVHEGHLHVARATLAQCPKIKQIVFVPAARSPGKSPALATPAQRLEWVSLTLRGTPFLVWDEEVKRGGDSYTVDTLEAAHRLGARRETLFWLLGADAYAQFPTWRSATRIRELCGVLVVNRPGQRGQRLDSRDTVMEIPPFPASSTGLRARLAAGEEAPEGLPAPVAAALANLLPGQNPYVKKI